jgi:phosphatidylinositol alpha-1,6-mannosyltransferase
MLSSEDSETSALGILVITWNYPPRIGGIESLIGNLCRKLKKRHPLFVITSFAASSTQKEDGIFRPRTAGLICFGLYAFWRGIALLWRHPEVRVILGGSAVVVPVVFVLGKMFRRRILLYVHGSDLMYRSFLYQKMCVRWLRHCDQVIANSHFTARLAIGKGVPAHHVSVVPPGVDWEQFSRGEVNGMRERLGLQGRKVVLYVGRLIRRKGLAEFVEKCLERVVAEVPGVCFLIVGDPAQESLAHHHDDVVDKIRSAVRAKKLEKHVRLLGWMSHPELAHVYALADLVILPALPVEDDIEGFGMVLTEAAAAGKPVVATKVGGIPDAVENGKSGVLVEPDDRVLTRALIALLKDDPRRLALGKYAQQRARESFDWDTIVRQHEDILYSVML